MNRKINQLRSSRSNENWDVYFAPAIVIIELTQETSVCVNTSNQDFSGDNDDLEDDTFIDTILD